MSRYGTTNGTATPARHSGTSAHGHHERQSLLGQSGDTHAQLGKLCTRMTAEVSRSHADLILLLCYIVTGLLDSASIQVWGSFVSMQTGNTVYVGLGLASVVYRPITPRLYKSGISLLSFCIGSFFFARFHRFFSPKRRWVLCASFAAQAALTMAAAIIVTVRPTLEVDTAPVDWTVLLPLALIAFQSCGQAVTSRALKYNALTSVVLTSVYCDLFSDQDLFKRDNAERNRRASAPVFLLGGAVIGGLLAHSPVGIQGALWAAGVIKSLMVIVWVFWPAEEEEC
ncbi:hypothetical protein E4U15_003531 [Claviceps sp. LM218 group G6]|nr:hypothetical protein E4U15_003531 [Claviceps sp. LM218 group G6]